MKTLNPTIKYALFLIGHGLRNTIPSYDNLRDALRDDSVDFVQMSAWCNMQSVGGIVATVLSNARAKYGEQLLSDEIMAAWDESLGHSFSRRAYFDIARKEIFDWFDKENIWYVPLKGLVIDELYPHKGMREMSDNDILFDAKMHAELKEFMLAHGYSIEHYDKGHDDIYVKEPCLNFEMHRFIDAVAVDTSEDYYKSLGPSDSRLYRASKDSCEYKMTLDALYIYHIVHTAGHFRSTGTGFRPLADLYLLSRQEGLDRTAIMRELEVLGLCDFNTKLCSIVDRLWENEAAFDERDFTEGEMEVLCMMASAGALGSNENRVALGMRRLSGLDELSGVQSNTNISSRLSYLMRRAFPPVATIRRNYATAKKHPITVPYYYVYRIIHAKEKAQKEVNNLLKK